MRNAQGSCPLAQPQIHCESACAVEAIVLHLCWLLRRWLLLRREAGGIEQRQKHVNVLMYGECQQLTALRGPLFKQT